jgi:hypothetical protein
MQLLGFVFVGLTALTTNVAGHILLGTRYQNYVEKEFGTFSNRLL